MKEFMVEANLPVEWAQDFMDLIPDQRDMLEDLADEGKIEFYSLSLDRSRFWMLVKAESEDDVYELIADFPLADYMEFDVKSLMFMRTASKIMASFSLN